MNEATYYPDYAGQTTTTTMSQPRHEIDQHLHQWMLDQEEILLELQRSLKGVIFDKTSNRWVQAMKPLVNDEGVNFILYILRPYTSKIFSLSKFNEEDIKYITLEFDMDLIPWLAENCDNFDIDPTDLSMIKRIVSDAVYSTLRKAEGALTLGMVRDTSKTVETVGEKGNNLGGFFNLFGKK